MPIRLEVVHNQIILKVVNIMISRLLWILYRIKIEMLMRISDEYTIAELFRKYQGIRIGKRCRIIGRRFSMFGSEPYLVEIGDNVTIAEDVKFITHDGGVAILRDKVPDLNVYGKIIIRDNCFIGVNSVLMPNITIGPNTVVGAGAVVTRDVPPNTIAAGVPAKVIMSTEEYFEKAVSKGLVIATHDGLERMQEILKHVNGEQAAKYSVTN
jgi:acetyltransferase-like isoleucine patch superfamily enzyme